MLFSAGFALTRLWEHCVFFVVFFFIGSLSAGHMCFQLVTSWSQAGHSWSLFSSLPDLLEEVCDEDGECGHGEGHVAQDPREGRRGGVDAEGRRGGVLHGTLDRR